MSRDVSRRTGWRQYAHDGVLSRLTSDDDDMPGPDWLKPSRRAALGWVSEHGFPTAKHEDWRYTRLESILGAALEPADPVAARDRAVGIGSDQFADLGGPRLVFVNGYYRADLSRPGPLPAGAVVTGLADALPEHRRLLEPVLARDDSLHAFAAINRALAPDGVFVHLGENVWLTEPIQLLYLADPVAEKLLASPRAVFLLDAGSRAQVIETHVGTVNEPATGLVADELHCTNAVTDVRLGEAARLDHVKLQNLPLTAYHLAMLDVRQESGSRFCSRSAMLGAAIARQEVRVELAGDGAEVELDGLYLPGGNQVHDNTVFVDHAAPHCSSQQLYKGVLDGRGRGIFNGHVVVRAGASGTEAHQVNKNLVLSDRAEADTRPRLEIYNDDVSCTHGAAVGQLDEDALLYLRSRGIDADSARQVLVRAFVAEMVERIGPEPLREQLELLLEGERHGR